MKTTHAKLLHSNQYSSTDLFRNIWLLYLHNLKIQVSSGKSSVYLFLSCKTSKIKSFKILIWVFIVPASSVIKWLKLSREISRIIPLPNTYFAITFFYVQCSSVESFPFHHSTGPQLQHTITTKALATSTSVQKHQDEIRNDADRFISQVTAVNFVDSQNIYEALCRMLYSATLEVQEFSSM